MKLSGAVCTQRLLNVPQGGQQTVSPDLQNKYIRSVFVWQPPGLYREGSGFLASAPLHLKSNTHKCIVSASTEITEESQSEKYHDPNGMGLSTSRGFSAAMCPDRPVVCLALRRKPVGLSWPGPSHGHGSIWGEEEIRLKQ